MSAVSTPVDEVPDVATLSASHRCERCGAQAYVRVRLPSGATLDFCAHDFKRSETALGEKGASVLIDDRHRLEPAG